MPRFYFDICEGPEFIADDEGSEYADLDAAEREAVLAAAELSKDRFPTGRVREIAIGVRDRAGQRLLTATVSMQIERVHLLSE
ncbi:hypothetical protein OPKNFCMD_5851 [Methylobacterium crusticola]|uniref:DUF6894 domain-containing protein n=1 Tax=Methylobacterium crusticola TaxID=1697972 RepID=A0ABQ4R851_9HYPH|nr:hypothetical protein [Methylobacterium crusticola]GJD53080.1 hypothetical protein OPKNFCMD_5851 [Methylobacterium crusticola]